MFGPKAKAATDKEKYVSLALSPARGLRLADYESGGAPEGFDGRSGSAINFGGGVVIAPLDNGSEYASARMYCPALSGYFEGGRRSTPARARTI